jgi:hypothetical protein
MSAKSTTKVKATFKGEVFTFLTTSFDIDAAIELCKDKEPEEAGIESVFSMFALIAIDKKYAESDEVDLTKPIIVAKITTLKDTSEEKPMMIPIDGWHRLWKAHKKGVTTLPVFVLEGWETDLIMKSPNRKRRRRKKAG